jgi:hypothetical protein
VQRVFERLRNDYGGPSECEIVTMFGCKSTKDYSSVNKLLSEHSDRVLLVSINHGPNKG